MSIFGGNTGVSYDDLQRKRALARQLMQSGQGRVRTVGEGINSAAGSIAGALLDKRAGRQEQKMREAHNDQFAQAAPQSQAMVDLYDNPMATDGQKRVLAALMKEGVPGFSRGGVKRRDGLAVVGEKGPELIYAPDGTEIQPIPMDEDLLDDAQGGAFDNWINGQNTFAGGDYQTADMSTMKPSGVGEEGQLNKQARAYQTLMKGLDDYEHMFDTNPNEEGIQGGSTMRPGVRRDELSTAHRNLQMQMKELYNLGVLNGPDLDLMNSILLNPTSASGNIMDALGIADMEERIPANISRVRKMMTDLAEPALQQLGKTPEDFQPKKDLSGMSDDELLKMLGGS